MQPPPMDKKDLDRLKIYLSSVFRRRPKHVIYSPEHPNDLIFTSIGPEVAISHVPGIKDVVHHIRFTDDTMDLFRRFFSAYLDLTKFQYVKLVPLCSIINKSRDKSLSVKTVCQDGILTYLIIGDAIEEEGPSDDTEDEDDDVTKAVLDNDGNIVVLAPIKDGPKLNADGELDAGTEEKVVLPKNYMSCVVSDMEYETILEHLHLPIIKDSRLFTVNTDLFRGKEATILTLPCLDGVIRLPYVDGHNTVSRIETLKKLDVPITMKVFVYPECRAARCIFTSESPIFVAHSSLPSAIHFILPRPQTNLSVI